MIKFLVAMNLHYISERKNEMERDLIASEATLDGYKRLGLAIVLQSFRDLRGGKPSEQLDAFDFMLRDAKYWLEALDGIDSELNQDILYLACNYERGKI
jgi:hypothetical protein